MIVQKATLTHQMMAYAINTDISLFLLWQFSGEYNYVKLLKGLEYNVS